MSAGSKPAALRRRCLRSCTGQWGGSTTPRPVSKRMFVGTGLPSVLPGPALLLRRAHPDESLAVLSGCISAYSAHSAAPTVGNILDKGTSMSPSLRRNTSSASPSMRWIAESRSPSPPLRKETCPTLRASFRMRRPARLDDESLGGGEEELAQQRHGGIRLYAESPDASAKDPGRCDHPRTPLPAPRGPAGLSSRPPPPPEQHPTATTATVAAAAAASGRRFLRREGRWGRGE
mmetsp:Transcript_8500/g.20885  ORF Transcript_8500/g.20885 Transcript_8500/m.20885 type:complete len:233 (+) Transcript_8500:723-1421(+)